MTIWLESTEQSTIIFKNPDNQALFEDSLYNNTPIEILGQKFLVSGIRRYANYGTDGMDLKVFLQIYHEPKKTPKQLMEEEIAAVLEKYKGKM